MLRQNLINRRTLQVAGTAMGSVLLGFVVAPAASAQTYYPLLNPCPGIYYEEPFNSTRIVPRGCPPNAITQQLTQTEAQSYGSMPIRTVPMEGTTPLQPPLPESRANAVATVALADNSFDVRLRNNTNAIVTYEVIGQTQRRYLQGGEEVMLQGIPAPATVTFTRQDDGFVEVVPMSGSQTGLLAVSLDEDANPSDQNQGVLRIQSDGQVFLN
jgi:hypothetical protein